jgi:hypothetical protein
MSIQSHSPDPSQTLGRKVHFYQYPEFIDCTQAFECSPPPVTASLTDTDQYEKKKFTDKSSRIQMVMTLNSTLFLQYTK